MRARRGSLPALALLLAALLACREVRDSASVGAPAGSSATTAASGYDLAGPPAWQAPLPAELTEISGLAATADGRVFAHGDEEATVYELDPRAGKVLKRFALAPTGRDPDLGKKGSGERLAGDFEGIAIAGDRFFLVTSNGVVLEFAEGANGATVPYQAFPTALGDICEVEGLTHDGATGSLLLLCKTMRKTSSERAQVTVWAWSLAGRRLDESPRIAVPYDALAWLTGGKAFNGSGLDFTPGGRSLLLVAGPQRLFVELGTDGTPVRGGTLDRGTLPQPEGIVFLRDGTLLVSSEGGKGQAVLAGYTAP